MERWQRSRRAARAIGALVLLLLALAACGSESAATAPAGYAASAAPAASTAPTATRPATSAAPASSAPAASAASSAPATSAAPATGAASPSAASTAPRASAAAASAAARYVIVPANSAASYKVAETFFLQNNRLNIAQGTTKEVAGDLTIDKTKPSASKVGTIKVDISKLASDSEERDDQIRNRWLESAKFPTATFVGKRVEGLPDTPYKDGDELTFKIIGDLTIRNVTKEITFDTKGKIVGDLFTGTGVAKFNMTDFGFDPPSILGLLKAENAVELTITIEAKQTP